MFFNMRSTAAALAASFGLLAAAPADSQPHSPSLSHLGAVPAQANVADISIKTINPPRAFYETTNTRCVLSTGLTTRLGDGVIFDTSRVYKVELHQQNQCVLKQVVRISPRNPQSMSELVSYLAELSPFAGAYLRRESIIPGMPPLPVDGSAGQGIRIPDDLMAAVLVAQELRLAGIIQQNTPIPDAAALPENWQEQKGLLPSEPQGPLSALGRQASGTCGLKIGNQQPIQVPATSIVIPDNIRAVFLDQQCRVHPLVTIPVQSNITSSIGNGGVKLPVPANNAHVQPAGGPLLVFLALSPETATLVTSAVVGLGAGTYSIWKLLGGSAVLTGDEAQQAFINKQSSGQSDTEIGRRTISIVGEVSSPIGPPDGPEDWPTNNWRNNGENQDLPGRYTFQRGQLQHAYDRHAADWDIHGPQNNENLALFKERMVQHMNSPSTRIVRGYYKGDRMIAFINPRTGLHVGFRPNGEFWTSFRLGPTQLRGLLEYGKFSQNQLPALASVAYKKGCFLSCPA